MDSNNQVAALNSSKPKSREWGVLILMALLLCSILLNLVLVQKVKSAREYSKLIKSESQLAVGTLVPSFVVRDLIGNTQVINYRSTDVPTILYIFSPSCEWCEHNIANIKALASAGSKACRVIGLSLSSDNLQEYAAKHNLNFPIYTELLFTMGSHYKLGGTPQTIVVSSEGRVLKNWKGAYDTDIKREIEEQFHIHLPDANT